MQTSGIICEEICVAFRDFLTTCYIITFTGLVINPEKIVCICVCLLIAHLPVRYITELVTY
jgi:hypothetical protein